MADPSTQIALDGGPLELLFELESPRGPATLGELSELYAGELRIERPRLIANFVASVDGAVALEGAGESGAVISGSNRADRFLMGLLRALSDVVLIGAGTYRASPRALWRPGFIYPPAAAAFAALRKKLALAPEPTLAIVTASGDLPAGPALASALILTTKAGAARLEQAGSTPGRVLVLADDRLASGAVVGLLHDEGHELLLTEGGPSLVGEIVKENLLDELFLTVSPRLFGQSAGAGGKTLLSGVELEGERLELMSVRRHHSHLFLRYRVER